MQPERASLDPANWMPLYGRELYQYALSRVDHPEEAEDLLQETLLSALKGRDGYKGEASEKNWLYSILKNKIVDFYRKKAGGRKTQQLPELNSQEDHWFDEAGAWQEQSRPVDWHFTSTAVEQKELRRIIEQCKEDLKEVQRQVFILKYLEEKDADFICKVLNISASNYWVLLHRCRLQMRTCVEHHWLKN